MVENIFNEFQFLKSAANKSDNPKQVVNVVDGDNEAENLDVEDSVNNQNLNNIVEDSIVQDTFSPNVTDSQHIGFGSSASIGGDEVRTPFVIRNDIGFISKLWADGVEEEAENDSIGDQGNLQPNVESFSVVLSKS